MIRIYDKQNKICINFFAKAGSQIIQKVFAEFANLPYIKEKEKLPSDVKNWVVIRNHMPRVLSVYYEKKLNWHNLPNNSRAVWGDFCNYKDFVEFTLPQMISNQHLSPYTKSIDKNFVVDKVYMCKNIHDLITDYCKESGKDIKKFIEICNEKIFHKVPYLCKEDSKIILHSMKVHPSLLDPSIIKEKNIYLRHYYMNTKDIEDKIRKIYIDDIQRFPELKF